MEKNYHILIADNDLHSASSMSNYLKNKENIKVDETTTDGFELLDLVELYQPDIVVMDTVLPNEDGLNVVKKIRLNYNLKQPIIIIYSALTAAKAVNAIMEVGADYFMSKPQSFETIYNTINELVSNNCVEKIETLESRLSGSIEDVVTEYLYNLGVPASVKGYRYLRSAIILALEDEENISFITKLIYPTVAKKHNSTSSKVERAIRHSIDCAWRRGRPEYINSIFGNTARNIRPTNSEFIAALSDKIRLQMKCCAI